MTPERDEPQEYWARVENILEAVLQSAPEEIDARLDELARDDANLAAEVRALLGHLPDPERDAPNATSLDERSNGSLVGRQLGGVLLTELLGVGGHGAVYRGEQGRPRRSVAVKVIDLPPPTFAQAQEEVLRRFEREAEIIARIEHPGIARIIAAGIDVASGRPIPYLITDFVEDPADLETWWRTNRDVGPRIDILIQIAETVQAAHERAVLHLDLKPPNILVDPDDRIRLIDFGIATVIGDSKHQELLGGSAGFASPEQLDPRRVATVRSDIYAVGRIIKQLLQIDPIGFQGQMGRDLTAVAARAAAIDPELRYSTASSLVEDLLAIREGIPPDAASPSATRRLVATMRRAPVTTTLVTALVCLGIVLLGLLIRSNRKLENAQTAVKRENLRLEATLREEAEARYRFELAAIGNMDRDPLAARRAILNIDPSREDFAIRHFRARLNQGLGAMAGKGINAYRLRASEDGTFVISGSAAAVRIFPHRATEPTRTWDDLGSQIFGVAISADGTRGIAGTEAGALFTLEPSAPAPSPARPVTNYEGGCVLGVAMHPAGRAAAILGADGHLHWVDLTADPPSVEIVPLGLDTRWCSIDVTAAGDRVVAGGHDGRFAILDIPPDAAPSAASIVWGESSTQRIRTIRWSPDSTRIAMIGGDRLTLTGPDGRIVTTRRLPTNSLWSLAWSPDGERLAVSGWDQVLRILAAPTLEPQFHRFGADGPVWTLVWPDPMHIATGEENAAIRWWHSETLTDETHTLPVKPVQTRRHQVTGFLVAGMDGSLHATNSRQSAFTELVPGLGDRRCRGTIDSDGFHRAVDDRIERFDSDGRHIQTIPLDRAGTDTTLWRDPRRNRYVVRLDEDVLMVEGDTGKVLVDDTIDGFFVEGAGFDERGRFHLACGFGSTHLGLQRLDPDRGVSGPVENISASNLRAAHRIQGGWITAAATNDAFIFSPDDSDAETIEVDLAHAGGINIFRTIDNGKTLVTGGSDGLVRLWSLPTFTPMLRVEGRTKASVVAISVMSDRRIVIGRADGSLQIVDAAPR